MTDGCEVTWFPSVSLRSADAATTCLFAEAHSVALTVVMPEYWACWITGFQTVGVLLYYNLNKDVALVCCIK
jgi:hypothetical protein